MKTSLPYVKVSSDISLSFLSMLITRVDQYVHPNDGEI